MEATIGTDSNSGVRRQIASNLIGPKGRAVQFLATFNRIPFVGIARLEGTQKRANKSQNSACRHPPPLRKRPGANPKPARLRVSNARRNG